MACQSGFSPLLFRIVIAAVALLMPAPAQTFSQRTFIETDLTLFPQTAPNDSSHAIGEALVRFEPTWKPEPWFKLDAAFDARVDTHQQDERAWHLDWQDRSLRRPAFSVRQLSAIATHGRFTFEGGKQFVRWGKADLLNPTDRFAPKDYLSVVDPEVLAITAGRVTYDNGTDSFDAVWEPRFTPSRMPLLDQRWAVLPVQLNGFALHDDGSMFPGRSSFGGRWDHIGSGYEFSLCYFDGFNHLPLFAGALDISGGTAAIDFHRFFPSLRLYGGDAAVPLRWFTFKSEAAYYTSPHKDEDNYVLYVLELERQIHELTIAGGYAGDVILSRVSTPQFSPEQGLARAFLGRAMYQIGPTRSATMDWDVRQNGRGMFLRWQFSQAFGQHWRATGGFARLAGEEGDFLGQYHRNSYGIFSLRYSL